MLSYDDAIKKSGAFVRVPWHEVHAMIADALREKYGAIGKIEYKKDMGCYEGIRDAYEIPTCVDVYLEKG